MDYSSHIKIIKSNFPELDLIKKSEFYLFNNKEFTENYIKTCVILSNRASKNLKQNINFGIILDYTFNASAKVKGNHAIITFNIGLIEKLDIIISNSISLFMSENLASITINQNQIEKLKQASFKYSIYYLFYHELAHVIQLSGLDESSSKNVREQYLDDRVFDKRKHVYEVDADLFGSLISAFELMKDMMNQNQQVKTINFYNTLTLLLFTTANIIIELSGNTFKEIYYKRSSHPHPFIRILKCHEQILGNISINTNVPKQLFEAVLQRSANMVSQLIYTNGRTLDYKKFYNEHSARVEEYIKEIEEENNNYKELTEYKSKGFHNSFIY